MWCVRSQGCFCSKAVGIGTVKVGKDPRASKPQMCCDIKTFFKNLVWVFLHVFYHVECAVPVSPEGFY